MSKRWICSVCGTIEKGTSAPLQCPSCGAPFTAFELRERNPLAKFHKIEIVDERPAGFRYVIVGNSAAGRAAERLYSIETLREGARKILQAGRSGGKLGTRAAAEGLGYPSMRESLYRLVTDAKAQGGVAAQEGRDERRMDWV